MAIVSKNAHFDITWKEALTLAKQYPKDFPSLHKYNQRLDKQKILILSICALIASVLLVISCVWVDKGISHLPIAGSLCVSLSLIIFVGITIFSMHKTRRRIVNDEKSGKRVLKQLLEEGIDRLQVLSSQIIKAKEVKKWSQVEKCADANPKEFSKIRNMMRLADPEIAWLVTILIVVALGIAIFAIVYGMHRHDWSPYTASIPVGVFGFGAFQLYKIKKAQVLLKEDKIDRKHPLLNKILKEAIDQLQNRFNTINRALSRLL